MNKLTERIFKIHSEEDFQKSALEIFEYQYNNNKVYHKWCDLLNKNTGNVKKTEDIPFLPIRFFKTHEVVSFTQKPIHFFKSSGTTMSQPSRHFIKDFGIYEESSRRSFQQFFGKVEDYCFLALLPNYQQQGNSSLVYMINHFINRSLYSQSGLYSYDLDEIRNLIMECEHKTIPTILFGVTYALLDLIEKYSFELKHTTVFETGGMKGRRKEMPKSELHSILAEGFGIKSIASEYGMCELFSQAYSKSDGIFYTPNQMKVVITETEDPFTFCKCGKTGVINVIDLANINTCSFIATEDLGRSTKDGGFEIMGRVDNSDIRGCNLMYE